MRLLVINASPKGERSNTMNITCAFVSGFPDGTELETVELYKCDVKPCTGCYYCWKSGTGVCKIKDDVKKIHDKIFRADIIIFSFPLYFFGVPSQLKALTDRCLPLMVPYMSQSTDPYSASFHDFKDEIAHNKKLVIISSCGYVEAEPVYSALLCQIDLILGGRKYTPILCPQGEIFVADHPIRQRESYLADIKKAGGEFAQNLCLTEETAKRISKPILTSKGFGLLASRHFLPKNGKA